MSTTPPTAPCRITRKKTLDFFCPNRYPSANLRHLSSCGRFSTRVFAWRPAENYSLTCTGNNCIFTVDGFFSFFFLYYSTEKTVMFFFWRGGGFRFDIELLNNKYNWSVVKKKKKKHLLVFDGFPFFVFSFRTKYV